MFSSDHVTTRSSALVNTIRKERRDVNFPVKKMHFDITPEMWLSTSEKSFTVKIEKSGFKKAQQGFPGGAVVGSLPANAGDTGSSPGLGRSHMPWGNWARGPQLLSLRVWSLCSAIREAAMVRGPRTAMKSGPCLPQLGKALAQKRRPNTAKNK